MKKSLTILVFALISAICMQAQLEPDAGKWKPWFISIKDFRLPAPLENKNEIAEVVSKQQQIDSAAMAQIVYWNAGAPGYRWHAMMDKSWQNDTLYTGALANLLLGTAIYDATIAAWDIKYAYNRKRPFVVDKRIKAYSIKPDSPSYPCEYSVAAGAAVAIFSKFYPSLKDSVTKLAQQLMASRVAAGLAYPSDTRDGFELGKRIAEKEIELTKDYANKAVWDGKLSDKPGTWKGKPMFPLAGNNKTVVLTSGSQFRPGPPPDFAKDMDELKKFKPTFRSTANAFFHATQSFWGDALTKKLFEHNLHLNPPRAARIYAASAVAAYDGFTACWDAKYAYWGIRPDQYDTTYRPPLFFTPPFPGYPSGHAMLSSVTAELFSYFFPADKQYFRQKAKEIAESRFQGGIHFRTDNEVANEMGKKVGDYIVQRIKNDGVDK